VKSHWENVCDHPQSAPGSRWRAAVPRRVFTHAARSGTTALHKTTKLRPLMCLPDLRWTQPLVSRCWNTRLVSNGMGAVRVPASAGSRGEASASCTVPTRHGRCRVEDTASVDTLLTRLKLGRRLPAEAGTPTAGPPRPRGLGLLPTLAAKATFLALFLALGARAQVTANVWTFRGANTDDRRAYFAQPVRFWGSGKYPDDPATLSRLVVLSSGRTAYGLWVQGKTDAKTGAWHAAMGMCLPSKANWYSNGFLDVLIDGKNLTGCPTEFLGAQGGKEGTAQVRWKHPAGNIQAELQLLPGDDKLLMRVSVSPNGEACPYTVALRCYPGSIRGGFKPDRLRRKREALTAKRVLVRPEWEDNNGYIKTDLAKDEPWVLFYDQFFDVGDNRGEGPCAVCYHPGEVTKSSAVVENYGCFARFEYPAGRRDAHIVLWDLRDMSNAAARDYMHALEVTALRLTEESNTLP
jgi:hypothetical protein